MKTGLWVIILVGAVLLMAEVLFSFSQRRWGGIERFTIIETGNKEGIVWIKSVDPETRTAVMIKLPKEMEISTVGGKGEWKINSLPQLSLKYGKRWAADSIADFLGIVYTDVEEEMGIWDRILWIKLTSGVEWQEVNLEETSWIKTSFYPDGDEVLGLSGMGQKKIGEMFYSAKLAKEELTVSIFNTTQETGLGTRFARAVENSGLKVATVGVKAETLDKCLVASGWDLKDDPGVKWLVRSFSCSWQGDDRLEDNEVSIFIGSEYVDWLVGEKN